MQTPQAPLATSAQNIEAPPVDGRFLEQAYDQLNIAAFEALDEATPKLSVRANR
jgi:hypothetical protein